MNQRYQKKISVNIRLWDALQLRKTNKRKKYIYTYGYLKKSWNSKSIRQIILTNHQTNQQKSSTVSNITSGERRVVCICRLQRAEILWCDACPLYSVTLAVFFSWLMLSSETWVVWHLQLNKYYSEKLQKPIYIKDYTIIMWIKCIY